MHDKRALLRSTLISNDSQIKARSNQNSNYPARCTSKAIFHLLFKYWILMSEFWFISAGVFTSSSLIWKSDTRIKINRNTWREQFEMKHCAFEMFKSTFFRPPNKSHFTKKQFERPLGSIQWNLLNEVDRVLISRENPFKRPLAMEKTMQQSPSWKSTVYLWHVQLCTQISQEVLDEDKSESSSENMISMVIL